MLLKCELRRVPKDIVLENFAHLVRSVIDIPSSCTIWCIFNPDTQTFMQGKISFQGATRRSKEEYNILLRSLPPHQQVLRTDFVPSLFLDEGVKDEQTDERFSSEFNLALWSAQNSLPSMFRRNRSRGESILSHRSAIREMDMSQIFVQESRQDTTASRDNPFTDGAGYAEEVYRAIQTGRISAQRGTRQPAPATGPSVPTWAISA